MAELVAEALTERLQFMHSPLPLAFGFTGSTADVGAGQLLAEDIRWLRRCWFLLSGKPSDLAELHEEIDIYVPMSPKKVDRVTAVIVAESKAVPNPILDD